MIISASRRTDIPAFFSPWLMDRVREGACLVSNPYNARQHSRVSLLPADVDAFVFWSKNPAPMLSCLDELDQRGFRYVFLFSLNAYSQTLEPNLPPVNQRLETFIALSERLGQRRVIWRYDPIILSTHTPREFHVDAFGRIASALAGHTSRVIVSLLDFYRKTERRLRALDRQGLGLDADAERRPDTRHLLATLRENAASLGMEMFACAEKEDFAPLGIPPARCVDGRLLQDLFGILASMEKDPGQRPACGCVKSRDIGTSNTCRHGCVYCYATTETPRPFP